MDLVYINYDDRMYNILKFLPEIRNIYVIVFNKNTNIVNERIKIIYYKDIIPENFHKDINLHILDIFFHKIPNISNIFLHLNNSIKINDYMSLEDFISFNKIPLYFK